MARALHRLYVPDTAGISGPVVLGADAAHRVRAVWRLRAGAVLHIFDGAGCERAATVVRAERVEVALELGTNVTPLAEPPVPVMLVCAFPRGQRGDWLVEKATEVGVTALVPVEAEHGVLEPGTGRVDRWRRIAIEAAEQCGRATVPAIGSTAPAGTLAVVLDPGAPDTVPGAIGRGWPCAAVALFVGPEGGWTAAERAAFAATGARFAHLGPRVLRVETAAVLGVAQAVQTVESLARG